MCLLSKAAGALGREYIYMMVPWAPEAPCNLHIRLENCGSI